VNAGEREIVRKKDGEEKRSARRSVSWGCHYDTTLILRLILNAAALVAASPTLLFSDW
jgi:hypothetical protein